MDKSSQKQHTILLVDDMGDLRAMLGKFLERWGYSVVEAEDGRQAVAAARENPSLILMDVYMPGVDGLSAALQIRSNKDTRHIPIIIISAYGDLGIDAELQRQAEAVGATAYLPKPIDLDALEALIERLLRER